MVRQIEWVLVAAVLMIGLRGPDAQAQASCQALREFDGLVDVVTVQFHDRTFNGLDWPARILSHRGGIACSDDSLEIAAKLNALLAELGASHTAAYSQADLDYWGLNALFSGDRNEYPIAFPGLWPERIGDRWYARFVLDDSAAERAGVQPGDELIAIGEAPFSPLGFGAGETVLTVSPNGRTTRELRFPVPRQSVIAALVDASLASARIIEHGAFTVGQYRIWAAHEAILDGLHAAVERFEAAQIDALVIDLRGPYGGTSDEYLAPISGSEALAQIPKYFLIDGSARSGKEWLAALIRRDGLGTLVGARTAGAFLSGKRNSLFDDRYLLYVAVAPAPDLGVGPIEGVGVEPHEVVLPCRTYCQGRDPIRERVLTLLAAGKPRVGARSGYRPVHSGG